MADNAPKRQLAHALMGDRALADEFLTLHGSELEVLATGGLEGVGDPEAALASAMAEDRGLEAIVERFGRPSLLVVDDTFEVPESDEWKSRLQQSRQAIDHAIARVGRVDIKFHVFPYAGTGWMVTEDVAITNRHVAKEFAHRSNGLFPFSTGLHGLTYEAYVDFAAEPDNTETVPVRVAEVLYIADDGDESPDLAFLKLEPVDGQTLPTSLALSDRRSLEPESFVVTVGYPARDSRQDADDQQRIFGGVYDVKRIAPGHVITGGNASVFNHDCTTLGGNSGSAVVDPESGEIVGLHFAGRREVANYAVSSRIVKSYLDRFVFGSSTVVRRTTRDRGRVSSEADGLSNRAGYEEAFLGEDFTVPVPSARADLVLPIEDDVRPNELRYTHFSVVMHRERRLAMYTAVNIDGSKIHRVKRDDDRWALDPRIPETAQIANELYEANPLDRGHLVRRLDPAWGETPEEAQLGVEDSFYYTNSAPQHLSLNRKTWLSLEDYILDNSNTHGFRACVFTGPVLGDDDPDYRGLAKLPQAFWKVAVMVREPDEGEPTELSATGYMLSQANLVSDLEFVFGPFRTFQVPIARIADLSGLQFAQSLLDADPLGAVESRPFVEIEGYSDLVL